MSKGISHTTDELSLIDGCKRGNSIAQKAFFTMYSGDMLILCLRYISNQEDARETLMDGFCQFFKKIDSFLWMGEGSAKAWLKKIMVNQCLMRLRARQSLFDSRRSVEELQHDGVEACITEMLTAKEIMKTIQQLPAGYRAVFNLYVFEELNHREIGDLLGISENTSKSQLHKAREILKKSILQSS